MIRLALACALLTLPALGQWRTVEIELEPTECASCTQSLPERLARVRGVVRSEMLSAPVRVAIELEPQSRIRLARLLDVVRQDGTGVRSIQAAGAGEVFQDDGWKFRAVPGGPAYAWQGPPPEAGRWTVRATLAPPFQTLQVEHAEPQK